MRLLNSHVFAADRLDNIIWWCSKQFGNNGELVDVVFPREKRFSVQHFSKDAPSTPDIHFNIVFLPRKHDFRRSIVSCRDIAGHLRVLDTRQSKIADLEITVLVYQDIT